MGVIPNPLRPGDTGVVWWAWAALVANVGIVLTGGLVRLTGSGLGCPTWPRCTDESFTPHGELGLHGAIEFGNRMLTYVLVAVVVATWLAVRRWAGTTRELKAVAAAIALGVPLQAVIGGISVLTDLNPWVVALHLIVSMVLIALSTWLLLRVKGLRPRAVDRWAALPFALTWVVVYLGTVVTGSGPHAGDADSPRNGLDPQVWSHVHAAGVYVLVAATVVAAWKLRGAARQAARVLFVVELGQGLVGFVQYWTDLPVALVTVHLVGAAVLVAVATRLLVVAASDVSRVTREYSPAAPPR